MKLITSFKDKYSFLSNFYPCRHIKSVEHYYQSHKSDSDKENRQIYLADTAADAKRLGRKVQLRKDWEKAKLDVMKNALELKFSDPVLRKKLIKTHPAKLVEGNYWHDNYWGDCTCNKCKNVKGKNMLGRLLMLLRIRLIKES